MSVHLKIGLSGSPPSCVCCCCCCCCAHTITTLLSPCFCCCCKLDFFHHSFSVSGFLAFSLLPPASASRPAFQPPPRHLQPHPLAKHARCFPADSQPSLILSWWLVYHCQTSPAEKSLPILRDPRKVRLLNSPQLQSVPVYPITRLLSSSTTCLDHSRSSSLDTGTRLSSAHPCKY